MENKDWAEGPTVRCQKYYKKGIIIPPGNEIYRDERVSVFEILGGGSGIYDKKQAESMGGSREQIMITEIAHGPQGGLHERIFCENLCLIAKLFLDHKNIRFDCTPFLFYVLIERNSASGRHTFAGYFSKEYGPKVENNLSCILVMPHCQRKGYGKFLIEFSYELSKLEKKKGTPERPLSDLGFRSYVSFWAIKIIKYLLSIEPPSDAQKLKKVRKGFNKRYMEARTKLSIENISDSTFIDT